jgi:hypothetical protein
MASGKYIPPQLRFSKFVFGYDTEEEARSKQAESERKLEAQVLGSDNRAIVGGQIVHHEFPAGLFDRYFSRADLAESIRKFFPLRAVTEDTSGSCQKCGSPYKWTAVLDKITCPLDYDAVKRRIFHHRGNWSPEIQNSSYTYEVRHDLVRSGLFTKEQLATCVATKDGVCRPMFSSHELDVAQQHWVDSHERSCDCASQEAIRRTLYDIMLIDDDEEEEDDSFWQPREPPQPMTILGRQSISGWMKMTDSENRFVQRSVKPRKEKRSKSARKRRLSAYRLRKQVAKGDFGSYPEVPPQHKVEVFINPVKLEKVPCKGNKFSCPRLIIQPFRWNSLELVFKYHPDLIRKSESLPLRAKRAHRNYKQRFRCLHA